MWEKVNNLCRRFRAFLELGKGEKPKCPRCKGTGLMVSGRSLSHHDHTWMAKEPCWFCEGLGILPIIGLEGFFLARASSQINTSDLKVYEFSPTWCGLPLSNHAGTWCKFITYKPADEISNFIFHGARTSPWLADIQSKVELSNAGLTENPALSVTLDGFHGLTSQLNDAISYPSAVTPAVVCSDTPVQSQSATSSFIRQQALDVDVSKPPIVFQSKSWFVSSTVVECKKKVSQSDKGENIAQGDRETDTFKPPDSSPSFGITPHDAFWNVTHVKFTVQEKASCQLGSSSCKYSPLSKSETRASICLELVLPIIRNGKIYRNVRQKRNRIREKAQEEAKENATRILKSLTPQETNSSITSPNDIPGVQLPISTSNREAVERSIETEKEEGLSFYRFQHAPWSMGTQSDSFWMKIFNFQMMKDIGATFTKTGRT